MARPVSALAALLLGASLAGCAVLDGGGDGRQGDLVRIVQFDLDPEAMDSEINDAADAFAALGTTQFEYTHDAGPVDPAGVTVEFVDDDGREREVPLSSFTDLSSVARGDRVTINGVLFTSPVRVRDGGNTLAARGDRAHNWVEAGGYPLPVALDPGGLAVWDLSGGIELDAGLDRFEVVEEWVDEEYRCERVGDAQNCGYHDVQHSDTFRLEDVLAVADGKLDGKLRLAAQGTGFNPEMVFGLDGTFDLGALFEAHVFEQTTGSDPSTSESDFGFELELLATGDGEITLKFDRDDQLRTVGGQGDLDIEGDLTYWDEDHPRSEGYSPEAFDDFDVSTPYAEEDVPFGDNPTSFVAETLADLWRMDLAPGDEFRLSSGDRFGEGMPSVTMAVRVIDEGRKSVPAGTFDALRIETTTVLEVPVEGGAPETFDLPTLVTWIDRDSGVPVAIEQTMAYDYDEQDFESLFAMAEGMDEGMRVTPPDEMHLVLKSRTLAELSESRDGLRMAPLASLLSPLASVAAPFASFFLMPLFGFGYGGGYDDYAEEAYPEHPEAAKVPRVALSMDDGMDSLTVIKSEPGLVYGEFEMRASQELRFARNGQASLLSDTVSGDYRTFGPDEAAFVAGDVIDFCGTLPVTTPTTLTIRYAPSNTILFESTLTSVAGC